MSAATCGCCGKRRDEWGSCDVSERIACNEFGERLAWLDGPSGPLDLPWRVWPWGACDSVLSKGANLGYWGRCELKRGHGCDHALERGMVTPRWSNRHGRWEFGNPTVGCTQCGAEAKGWDARNLVHADGCPIP